MDTLLGWFGFAWVKAALAAAAVSALLGMYAWRVHVEREIGRDEIRAEFNAHIAKQMAAAMVEEQANAKESFRRLARQQENQRAQDLLLAAARRDAALNAADADSMRTQQADTARRWRDALDHSPTGEQCAAAGAAITVQADLLGRSDGTSGELASYADAARAAGLKCQADYDALTASP